MKKKVFILILIFIFICLMAMTYLGFEGGLFQLLRFSDAEKKAKEIVKEEQDKSPIKNSPDWWITYEMPDCYKPTITVPLTSLGSVRIHWQKLIKDQPVQGTFIEEGDEIIYTGTFDGQHINIIDKNFYEQVLNKPLSISADFSKDFTSLAGTYKINGKINTEGCPDNTDVIGKITGKPCQNINGNVCP